MRLRPRKGFVVQRQKRSRRRGLHLAMSTQQRLHAFIDHDASICYTAARCTCGRFVRPVHDLTSSMLWNNGCMASNLHRTLRLHLLTFTERLVPMHTIYRTAPAAMQQCSMPVRHAWDRLGLADSLCSLFACARSTNTRGRLGTVDLF